MEQVESLSEELLKARAQQYIDSSTTEQGRFLTYLVVFRLEQQWFGLETSHIRQITRLEDGAIVPRAKPLLLGLANQAGIFIPLIDLCQILHLPSVPLQSSQTPHLIAMVGNKGHYGFLVEELHVVEEIDESQLLSQKHATKGKGAQLVETLVEISIGKQLQKVAWLKGEELEQLIEESL